MKPAIYRLLLDELSVIYEDAEAELWLQTPHSLLDGRRPVDCPVGDVLRVIDQLKTGAFV